MHIRLEHERLIAPRPGPERLIGYCGRARSAPQVRRQQSPDAQLLLAGISNPRSVGV